jgi:threonine aldolase
MANSSDAGVSDPDAPLDPRAELNRRFRAAAATVRRSLTHIPPATPLERAQEVAAYIDELAEPGRWDRYGEHGAVAELEAEVAGLLGKPAAAMFPSGIMAQQSALRVWTDRRGSKRVALPDLSHLLHHELDGPQLLHGFHFERLTTGPKVPRASDLAAIPGRLGAVLIELPLRDAGYLLPTWDELAALAAACRERAVPLHIDGARIWESQPYLGHSLAEIADLAATVYVSLYKGLGGLSGALVAGDQDAIDEVRRWRTRHGGTLFTLMPSAVSGLRGLRERLPQMTAYCERAHLLAAAFKSGGATVSPDPPHCNAFRLYLPVASEDAMARVIAVMEADQIALTPPWEPADAPGWSWTEFVVGAATMEWSVDEIVKQVVGNVVG